MTVAPLVLNVDDFDVQRYLRSRMLQDAGFEVIEAANGRQALALARERHPSLVVLDIHLPDVDGRDVCKQLKSEPSTADIIVLHVSASLHDPSARAAALNEGADGYLSETVDPAEFVAHVRALLRLAAAEAEARRAREALAETERRLQAERAQLEAVYQAMTAGVGVFNAAGEIVMANDVMARRSGYASAAAMSKPLRFSALPFVLEELDGTRVAPDDWPAARVLRGEALTDQELRVRRTDTGESWVFSYSGRAIRDSDGTPTLAVVVSADVTNRALAEAALSRANAELAESDRRKDEFLAVLSHELRNPLAPIRFALPLLRAQELSAEAARAVEMIQRQIEQLTRLVDDLLDVARISKGKIEVRPERVTLETIIRNAVEGTAPRFAAGGHILTLLAPEEPVWVHGDPARLSQVVTNLLVNAAKYSPPGAEVIVQAERRGAEAVIRVRDSGIGIRKEALPFVFDMFKQAYEPSEASGGLGIGLALVKRLVELHGGTVEAHSEGTGRGAEFVVRLPVAAVGSAESGPPQAPAMN